MHVGGAVMLSPVMAAFHGCSAASTSGAELVLQRFVTHHTQPAKSSTVNWTCVTAVGDHPLPDVGLSCTLRNYFL